MIAGEFEKVSFEQFLDDFHKNGFSCSVIGLEKIIYDCIKLPNRATTGSAGYDFYNPHPFVLAPGRSIIIPTGIRAKINPGWFLMIVPRSSLGFKYGMKLENTCGIIDSDYYCSSNEGHIMIKISVEKELYLEANDRFAQGILLPYGVVMNDHEKGVIRDGGFGSTGC